MTVTYDDVVAYFREDERFKEPAELIVWELRDERARFTFKLNDEVGVLIKVSRFWERIECHISHRRIGCDNFDVGACGYVPATGHDHPMEYKFSDLKFINECCKRRLVVISKEN